MIGESKSHGSRRGRPRLRAIDSRNLLLIFALPAPPTPAGDPAGGRGWTLPGRAPGAGKWAWTGGLTCSRAGGSWAVPRGGSCHRWEVGASPQQHFLVESWILLFLGPFEFLWFHCGSSWPQPEEPPVGTPCSEHAWCHHCHTKGQVTQTPTAMGWHMGCGAGQVLGWAPL